MVTYMSVGHTVTYLISLESKLLSLVFHALKTSLSARLKSLENDKLWCPFPFCRQPCTCCIYIHTFPFVLRQRSFSNNHLSRVLPYCICRVSTKINPWKCRMWDFSIRTSGIQSCYITIPQIGPLLLNCLFPWNIGARLRTATTWATYHSLFVYILASFLLCSIHCAFRRAWSEGILTSPTARIRWTTERFGWLDSSSRMEWWRLPYSYGLCKAIRNNWLTGDNFSRSCLWRIRF